MSWYALCVILALVRQLQASGHDDVCSRVAFAPLPKTLTCDSNCNASNTSIVWNMYNRISNQWHATFRYGQEPVVANDDYQLGIEIDSQGRLNIMKVNLIIHETMYNCSAEFSNGTKCGATNVFELEVFELFADTSVSPFLVQLPGPQEITLGSKAILCFYGSSPGIDADGTRWEKINEPDPPLVMPAQNVSMECPDCTTCDEERLLSLPSVVNASNSQYSAFFIAVTDVQESQYNDCFDIPNKFVSFVVINEVKEQDNRTFRLYLQSQYFAKRDWDHVALTVYKVIPPVIHEPQDSPEFEVRGGDNTYLVCNATTSGNATLRWEVSGAGSQDLILHSQSTILQNSRPDSSGRLISAAQLNDICATLKPNSSYVALSLTYPPGRKFISSPEYNGAKVLQQQALLVVCGASSVHEHTYTCSASDHNIKELVSLIVEVDDSGNGSTDIGAIVGVVVSAAVLIAIMILLGLWAHRRYRQLKYEAMQMRPMDVPLALTQLTHAVNQTFSTFSPIGSPTYDQFEFPRQNLTFLEVIGEGQFGQVWKARAIGICSEESRNIVAVKTLKDHHRESDYFDLRSELDIMRSMEPHPNIINLLGVCSDTLTKPLCILMEYAAYGSLKDYLADCRRIMQAQAQGASTVEPYLLSVATTQRQSMLLGDYPQLQQVMGAQSNDYQFDPMDASRTRRLLKMLQLEGYRANPDAPLSYDRLEPLANGEAGVSLYDRLYPQSQCVYRPCLETYNYGCYLRTGGKNSEQVYYNNPGEEYYNQSVPQDARGDSQPPIHSPTDSHIPTSPGVFDTAPLISTSQAPAESATQGKLPAATAHNMPLARLAPAPRLQGSGSAQVGAVENPRYARPPNLLGPTSSGEHHDTAPLIPTSQVTPELASGKTVPVAAVPKIPQLVPLGRPLAPPLNCSSPSLDDVFESPVEPHPSNLLAPSRENLRESMISFPDGYIYAPASTRASHDDDSSSSANHYLEEVEKVEREQLEQQHQHQQQQQKEPPPVVEEMIMYQDLLDFAVQIARGMDHLHKMQCVHRDLAARNILIAEDFTLKVGDFGLARELSDKDYYRKVTPGRLPARWMAPESLEERTHTYKSDVWSYAVVLWEIMTYGEVPYRGLPEANDCDNLAYYLTTGNRLPRPPNCTDDFHDLMTGCWALNPEKRPTFMEIISGLDNHLSAAHGYLMVSAEPAVNREAGVSSANPSPRMQKRKAMLQKLDKLQGLDRPVSIQQATCAKRMLDKSPSLPAADPLSSASPYLLPTPTQKEPNSTLRVHLGVDGLLTNVKFGSNPELSLSPWESGGSTAVGAGSEGKSPLKANGHGPLHNPRTVKVNSECIETEL